MADGGITAAQRTNWVPAFSLPAWQDANGSPGAAPPRRRRDACSRAITDKARLFIAENFADRITLHDLEKVTGCSSFAIMRAFRRGYGMTFHAFLTATRIAHATRLLAEGESAAVTALLVGFVDQSHFIRHFKRLLGTTPKRFLADQRRAQVPVAVGVEQAIAQARAQAAQATAAARRSPPARSFVLSAAPPQR
jgi:AraC-like DNA-binding protein